MRFRIIVGERNAPFRIHRGNVVRQRLLVRVRAQVADFSWARQLDGTVHAEEYRERVSNGF